MFLSHRPADSVQAFVNEFTQWSRDISSVRILPDWLASRTLRLKRITRRIFGLTIVLLSGCSALTPGLDSWEGHSIDELVASWGEPDSMTALGPAYTAYTWISEDGACEQSFTTSEEKIIGVSDTGCSG
jgi:hypothetical protein